MKIEEIENKINEIKQLNIEKNVELEKIINEKNELEKEKKSKNDTIERNILEQNKNEDIRNSLFKKYGNSNLIFNLIIWLFVGGIVIWIWFSFWLALLNTAVTIIAIISSDKRSQKKLNKTAYKTHNDEVKKYQAHNLELRKNVEELNKKIKNVVQPKIEKNKSSLQLNNKIINNNKLVLAFNQKYDIDNNNRLDIAETTNVDKLLSLKQKEIRDVEKSENRDYLKDLSKICLFLESFQKQLLLDYDSIQNSIGTPNDIDSRIKNFDREFKFYKALISSLILMISNIVNDNILGYYKLRDLFDKLSIFESNFEKKMISKLDTLNEATRELINITATSRDEIVDALFDVGLSVDDIKHKF